MAYRFSQCQGVAISGQPIRKVSATVLGGGNITVGVVTEAPSLKSFAIHPANQQRVPDPETSNRIGLSTDTRPVVKAVSGDFAAMTPGRYIIVRYTTHVAGNAYTKLNSGASYGIHRQIHYKISFRTILQTGWNYATGTYLTPVSWQQDSFGRDDAAMVNRVIPGEFTYSKFGLATTGTLSIPTRDDYVGKTD